MSVIKDILIEEKAGYQPLKNRLKMR